MSAKAATIPTPDELETIERQVMRARDELERLVWRLEACANEAELAPTFADLGALWAFQDMTGGYADELREQLEQVRALMPTLDGARLERAA